MLCIRHSTPRAVQGSREDMEAVKLLRLKPVPYAGIARIRFDGLTQCASQPDNGHPNGIGAILAPLEGIDKRGVCPDAGVSPG